MAKAESSTRLSDKYPVNVRVYVEKEALSICDKNEKISKSKGVRLQPCNGVTETQEATVNNATSVRLIVSIITDSLLCQFEKGSQAINLIRSQRAYRK
jgi:hypothetical protein